MNWENLKENKCPHCSAPIYAQGGRIRCTQCRFTREQERPQEIRIRWQMLHDMRCPICSNQLYPNPKYENSFRCLTEGCCFKITDERIQVILADDNHPANRHRR